MKGSLLVICFLLVGLGRGNTNRFFPRGDQAAINEAGYLANSYLVFGLNVSFYRLNYINPGRVVLFQDDCDLYPSVEVAPFSATGLSDLKNSFSGNFYYNSLSDQEDTEVLADIREIVSASTPGREHGVFAAQFGEIFTWENVSYKSTRAVFQMVVVSSTSGETFVVFMYDSVSHVETGEFEVFSGLTVQHTNSTSTVIVSLPSHKALTRGNTAEENSGTFVFKADVVSCYEEDLSAYICINDPPGNFTLVATNSSSAVFSFQDQTSPMNAVNFTIRCASEEHSTNMTLSHEDLQVLGTVTVSDLQPFTEYQCSVDKSHAYGHVQPSRHVDIFTGVKSAPSVPINLTVLERGSTYIVLGWSSPDPIMTSLPPATVYMIQIDGGPPKRTSEAKYNFTDLSPMQEYTIVVSAINRFGQSNYSEPITSSTSEEPFQDVTVSDPSANSVNITFKGLLTIQSEDDIQYIVLCMTVGMNGSLVSSTLNTSSIVEGVQHVTLTGLSASTTYNCSVTRYHSAGSNATQYVMFVTDPPDVTVSDPSANSVNITFKGPLTVQSEDDIQYIVLCMTVGVNGSLVSSTLNTSSIVEGVQHVTLTGLSPSTTYNCSVTRYHSAGSNTTQYVMFVTDPPEKKEQEEEGLSPGEIAGIVIGSVAAVALTAVGLGGVAALVKGGACCGGGAAEAAEGADPVAITEAGISVAEFVKEHCTCCCKKKDEEEDKGSKKCVVIKIDHDNEDDTESMLKDDTTEKTTAI